LVKNIRESASNSKSTYRLVIDLKKQSKASIFTLPPAKPYGHRLVIDLPHQAPEVKKPATNTANISQPQSVGRDVIIAIDAGHGGDDPGALGKFSQEKNVTLQIAKRLQKRINRQTGMTSFLIRTGDYYVNLNKRSELAFKGKADFLVSIHADGFTSSKPSGASVWILSDRRANSEMGRRMERHEVHSELLGGKGDTTESTSSVPFLNTVFFDMSKSNSMQVGSDVGNLVVKELGHITKLHKKKPVGASLAVLKSPYIPSILVEAGFITNHREERLLNQAEYQTKVSNAVFNGIYKHFNDSPPHDSLFAQKKRAIKHTVRSGESLSILGERYSVSTSELKSYNHLKSSSLRIGQVLKIPPNYQLYVKSDPTPVRNVVSTQAQVHTVKSGESLSVIASRYGSSTNKLKEHNNLRTTRLTVGQKIKIPGQVVAQAQPTVHVVSRGESLSVIAKRYGKGTNELKDFNKLRSTTLAVGQKIKIPNSGTQVALVAETPKPAPIVVTKPVVHTVSRGESLSVIASSYGKSTNEVKSYNNLRSTTLSVGQKLKIPNSGLQVASAVVAAEKSPIVATKVPSKPIVHTVSRGESLSVIASSYGKSTNEVKSYNNLRSTTLSVGQKLKIPGSGSQVVAAPVKAVTKPVIHTVRSGESLSVIASRYGHNTSEIKDYNKLRSTKLSVGQKLKIPNGNDVVASPIKVAVKPTVHTVRSGESLSVIGTRYGKSTSELKDYNNLRSTSLQVGQKIKIPAAGTQITKTVVKAPAKPSVHTVQRGDSLSVIAKKHGRTTTELRHYNNLRSTQISVGQKIKIPAKGYVVKAPTSNKPAVHTVRSGESLSVIAAKYNTNSSVLKHYNNLRSTSLQVGQKIKVPAGANKLTTHKVRSGESLSVIAKRYGTTASVIKSINKLRSNSLAIGQLLTIPTT
jgi:N-acetylmuramoyl-L-alanine amidase